ncbi:RloB family protein [Paraliomyxa miuraensis]|uniref:RloB family protein n=1 Tax=Paraliomyxa miuraensis TaxID=376150 RepID=UPI00225AE8CC|nr:RloB family protein [Paraliomyxa miuraensis]MCX4248033.1 RloB family protein [Paraliomyxa miuraensis]
MVSKRRHRQRRAARGEPRRRPHKRFLVLCEGKNTEPQYIKGFKRWCRNPLVDVEIAPDHGVPRTLVERARDLAKEAKERARREQDDNLSYDEVWCVFDRDEHPHVDDACQMARDNDIEIALSNPCFELWLLLHFRESPGLQNRWDVVRMLKKFVPGYDKHVDFDVYASGYEAAVVRARRLDEAARTDGEEDRNPTTGVHRMTESIREG